MLPMSSSWPSTMPSIPQSGTVASIPETSMVQPDEVQTGAPVDRLDQLPFDQFCGVAEWLTVRDSLQLMKTSRQNHSFMHHHYQHRLTPELRLKSGCPLFHYCDPKKRLDRYVPTDTAGKDYLSRQEIYATLARQIAKGELSIKSALNFIEERRALIQLRIKSGSLIERQKRFLCNTMVQELIWSGCCNIETALGLASDSKHLFYILTLRGLFRFSDLVPEDLTVISAPGLEFLHDLQLSQLFVHGPICKHHVLNLTSTQLAALMICRVALTNKTVVLQKVLALTEQQIANLREMGFTDDLHAGRIKLDRALQLVQIKLSVQPAEMTESSSACSSGASTCSSSMSTSSPESGVLVKATPKTNISSVWQPWYSTVSRPVGLHFMLMHMRRTTLRELLSDPMVNPISVFKSFGNFIHLLSPDDIIRFMNPFAQGDAENLPELFEELGPFAVENNAEYLLEIYINLASRLNSVDYLYVVRPFLNQVFGTVLKDALFHDDSDIAYQCNLLWSSVRAKCAVSGFLVHDLRQSALSLLKIVNWAETAQYISAATMNSFGCLLHAMDLLHDDDFFNNWAWDWTPENLTARFQTEDAESIDYDHYQALFSPFEKNVDAASLLDAIALKMEERYQLDR